MKSTCFIIAAMLAVSSLQAEEPKLIQFQHQDEAGILARVPAEQRDTVTKCLDLATRANGAENAKDFKQAIGLWRQALTVIDGRQIRYRLVCSLAQDGQSALALTEFAKAADGAGAGTFYPDTVQGDQRLASLRADPKFAEIVKKLEFKPKPQDLYTKVNQLWPAAEQASNGKNWELALAKWQEILNLEDSYGVAYYHMGVAYANSGKIPEAITALKKGASFGFSDYDLNPPLAIDPDVATLRPSKEFGELAKQYAHDAATHAADILVSRLINHPTAPAPIGKAANKTKSR
jgi:tetratricopeptide (TPR) repeat protein